MNDLGVLIPIIAVSIPLVAVAGRVIVQPIVHALTRLADTRPGTLEPAAEQRLARMEAQLELMERTLGRVSEAQDFQNRLLQGRPAATDQPSSH